MIREKLSNYFCLENQLWELQTGKDIAILFEKENVLQKNRDRKVFEEALQAVRRNDLAVKLEKYIVRGMSKQYLLKKFNQWRRKVISNIISEEACHAVWDAVIWCHLLSNARTCQIFCESFHWSFNLSTCH